MRGLEDKRVLITGGAGGIGSATASRFLEERSRVVVLDRDEAALARLESELPALSGSINADVSNADDVAQGFEELDELLGGLDVLINNAGISNQYMPYYQGAILELLIKASYADDARIEKGLDWFLTNQSAELCDHRSRAWRYPFERLRPGDPGAVPGRARGDPGHQLPGWAPAGVRLAGRPGI
jgi:NAD(P)-dependent dehydrogenase (short-subunit alcohol dehydrogenase family)